MQNAKVSNPHDFEVVEFNNSTNFDFTPEMGCMYDSRPISGTSGFGIVAGEKKMLPYHVGYRLAINLAKMCMVKEDDGNPPKDAQGNPMIRPLWGEERVEEKAKSFIPTAFTEAKPIAQSETDKLMERVAELEKFIKKDESGKEEAPAEPSAEAPVATDRVVAYQDKAEVIAELEKRGITHDKRKSKAELEKLLN